MTVSIHEGKCRLCGEVAALNESICGKHTDGEAQAYLFGFEDGKQDRTPAPAPAAEREGWLDRETIEKLRGVPSFQVVNPDEVATLQALRVPDLDVLCRMALSALSSPVQAEGMREAVLPPNLVAWRKECAERDEHGTVFDSDIVSLIDRLEAALKSAAPSAWQGMETAPKDGSWVLAFAGRDHEGAPVYGATRWATTKGAEGWTYINRAKPLLWLSAPAPQGD